MAENDGDKKERLGPEQVTEAAVEKAFNRPRFQPSTGNGIGEAFPRPKLADDFLDIIGPGLEDLHRDIYKSLMTSNQVFGRGNTYESARMASRMILGKDFEPKSKFSLAAPEYVGGSNYDTSKITTRQKLELSDIIELMTAVDDMDLPLLVCFEPGTALSIQLKARDYRQMSFVNSHSVYCTREGFARLSKAIRENEKDWNTLVYSSQTQLHSYHNITFVVLETTEDKAKFEADIFKCLNLAAGVFQQPEHFKEVLSEKVYKAFTQIKAEREAKKDDIT